MADNRSAFIQRVISGLLAALLLLGTGVYGGSRGLQAICTVMIVLGIREFSRMAFRPWNMPAVQMHLHWILSLTLYLLMYWHPNDELLWFSLANVIFMAGTLWLTRGKTTNENLLPSLAMGIFGFIYCVLFPYYAVRLVQIEDGQQWFLFLLLVVFFGDTFAYFSGRWFGKRKFMPLISPNKTWAGSLGGLVGSALAGMVHVGTTFQDVALWKTFLFCLACGVAAQSGDLLMSLVKRVAGVKDSGTIMPGHGGVLDRLDGVYIACPMVYAFATYVHPLL